MWLKPLMIHQYSRGKGLDTENRIFLNIYLLNPAIALHAGVSYFAFVCLSVCVYVSQKY